MTPKKIHPMIKILMTLATQIVIFLLVGFLFWDIMWFIEVPEWKLHDRAVLIFGWLFLSLISFMVMFVP